MREGLTGAAAIAVLGLLVAACSYRPSPEPPGPGPIWQSGASASFIVIADSLRSQTLRVARRGEVWVEPFSVTGEIMQVEREAVLVFDYPDQATRAEEAERAVNGGARLDARHAARQADPHVWARDTVIVLYAGANEDVVSGLTAVLGPPKRPP